MKIEKVPSDNFKITMDLCIRISLLMWWVTKGMTQLNWFRKKERQIDKTVKTIKKMRNHMIVFVCCSITTEPLG